MNALLTSLRKRSQWLFHIDANIRNRIIAIAALLSVIIFLLYFSFQQGFTSWESINSKMSIFVAININIVLMVVVFYMLLRNLLKLLYERNQKILGVNLKTKLIVAFLLLSMPATLFHLFASSFISSTLETWLAGQHEAVIRSAQNVSKTYHQNLKKLMELQGLSLEKSIVADPNLVERTDDLDFLITQQTIDALVIYGEKRKIIYQSLRTQLTQKNWKPLSAFEWEQVESQSHIWLAEDVGKRLIYRHLRAITVGRQHYVIEIFFPASKMVSGAVNDINEQEINTQLFAESENLIKRYYILIFLFITILIGFVATWLAFYLARGFVLPIENLAEATHRVANGELGFQVVPGEKGVPLDRDFGTLVTSFNAMSTQLLENQIALEKTTENLQHSHQALEAHTRFVELVLENILTGVMSLNIDGRVNGLNRAAKALLQIQTTQYEDRHYREVLRGESLQILEEMVLELQMQHKKAVTRDLTLTKHNMQVHISVTLHTLENREGKTVGMISVYENITELLRFQRARAWREVARRIAHEIKNPLTPIQLSADRLRRKYLDHIEDGEVLDQATRTIINEVEMLKKMVKEFSNFARLPESNPQPGDLNATIFEAVELYRNALPKTVLLETIFADNIPRMLLDREQLKRVMINLVDNALAAIEGKGHICIRSEFLADLQTVRVVVEDDGPGVAPEIRDRLFEPYATTKKHGTGLGLTIVAQIISDHNGFIRFQAPEGGGTSFIIEIPVA